MKKEQDQVVLMESVTLIMPHTHGGKDYLMGETIGVTKAQESWLAQRGIIATDPQTQPGE